MLIDKFRRLWSLTVVLYVIFLALQFTPYNVVDLRFSGNAKTLSALNTWIKENPQEHKEIMSKEPKETEITFDNLAKDTAKKTFDEQFTLLEVKELSKDIEDFNIWNDWRMEFFMFNGTLFFIFLIYVFIKRRF